MDFDDDAMQTIRPYIPRRQSESSIDHDTPTKTPTAIRHSPLPPPQPTPTKLSKKKLVLPQRNVSRPTSVFREDSFEDYSDLAPVNEANFARKVLLMKVTSGIGLPRVTPSLLTRHLKRRMPL